MQLEGIRTFQVEELYENETRSMVQFQRGQIE